MIEERECVCVRAYGRSAGVGWTGVVVVVVVVVVVW